MQRTLDDGTVVTWGASDPNPERNYVEVEFMESFNCGGERTPARFFATLEAAREAAVAWTQSIPWTRHAQVNPFYATGTAFRGREWYQREGTGGPVICQGLQQRFEEVGA